MSGEKRIADDLSTRIREAWKLTRSYEPPGYGQPYRTPMWEFVRRAKADPDLECLEAHDAAAMVERVLNGWSDGVGEDPWQEWFPKSDDGKVEFIDTWQKIKWPRSELDRANAEAARLPLRPLRSGSLKYEQFVSIAGHLQRGLEGPILLPVAKIADLLGCEPMTVSRYRRLAEKDGLLRLVSKGIRAQRKADEFRFAMELFDWQSGQQIRSEDLSICVTSSGCYTEIQESQEIEREKDNQDRQEKKETQEMQRETRALLPDKRKCAVKQSPYIPTVDEVAQELQKTAHLRTCVNER